VVGQAYDFFGDVSELDVAGLGHADEVLARTVLVDVVPLHVDAKRLAMTLHV
jgi:hypothetical protein